MACWLILLCENKVEPCIQTPWKDVTNLLKRQAILAEHQFRDTYGNREHIIGKLKHPLPALPHTFHETRAVTF